MARGKATALRTEITKVQAVDMARACLAWHRHKACKTCGGHGQHVIKGSTTIGGAFCKACRGTGNLPFEKLFRHDWRELARWLVAEMRRGGKGEPGRPPWLPLASNLTLDSTG